MFGEKTYKLPPEVEASIPYTDICDRYLLDAKACTHAFYEVEAPATDVASAAQLNTIREILVNLIDNLPERIFQIQFNYATCGDYRDLIVKHGSHTSDWPASDGLRQARASRLLQESKDRKLIRSSTVMTLGVLPIDGGSLSARQLSLAKTGNVRMKDRPIEEADFITALAILKTSEGLIETAFERAGIKVRPMKAGQIAEYLYRLFNPGMSNDWGIPAGYDYDTTPFNSAWLRNDFKIEKDSILIGDYYHSFVSMNGKPHGTFPRIIENLTTELGFNDVRTTVTIRRLDRNVEADNMKTHLTRTLSRMREPLSFIDRIISPGKQEDIITAKYNREAADEAAEASQVISDLRTGKEFLAMIQVTVHTWAKKKEEIDRRRQIIATNMSSMNSARAWCETAGTFDIFRQSLPASSEPHMRWSKVVGRMAADLIPLHRGFEGGTDPLCLFRNRTGGLVALNLNKVGDAMAPISFVAGGSGSGKSFLVNQLIFQHLEEGSRVMIMDIGGSYLPLVKLLGGQVISMDPDHPCRLNPLQMFGDGTMRLPTPDERIKIGRTIEALMLRDSDDGELPDKIIAVIDRAILKVFDDGTSQGLSHVDLSMLAKVMSTYPDGAEPCERLRRFLKGGDYGQWFDGSTTIDANSRVVCFDLKGVSHEKRLCAAMAPLIISYIYEIVRNNKKQQKMFVMDEMWEFIAQPRILDFVVEVFKTFRKEKTTVLGVSQNLGGDIASNPRLASAIMQNTETWFLLEQGGEKLARATAELLSLTDGQRDMLRKLRKVNRTLDDGTIESYRECLLIRAKSKRNADSGIIQIRVMPEEYWMFTTEPTEALLMADVTSRFSGDVLAAAKFLGAKYPGGLALFHQRNIETGKAELGGEEE